MSTRSFPRIGRWWPPALAIGLALLGAGWVWSRHRAAGPIRVEPEHWRAVAEGRAALGRGRPDLALQAVGHIRDEAPGSGEAMTVAGLAMARLHELKGARLALERALKLQPNQVVAARALAQLYLELGDGARGAEMLRTVARLDSRDDRPWAVLGRVHHDLGEPEKAADAFEQSLRLRPDDPETRVALVQELLKAHQPDRAAPWLAQALRDRPDDLRLLSLAAVQARESGRPEEAATLAGRVLARAPADFEALLIRAKAGLVEGQEDRALVDLERAVAARPNDVGALQLLATVETRLGLTGRATGTLERHRRARDRAVLMDRLVQEIAGRPDDPIPRFRLGQVAAEGGATLLAARCFQAALTLDPNFQPTREALAALPPTPPHVPPPS